MLTSDILMSAQKELDFSFIESPLLSEHSSFKIGGPAKIAVFPNNTDALSGLIKLIKSENEPYFILGNGSNMLFSDEGFNGTVIITSQMSKMFINGNCVTAQCGASLIRLSRFALENSLSGLEFAYGIPGTVGGAVYMNAGAYDGEVSRVLESCRCFDTECMTEICFDAKDCGFDYRNSLFMKTAPRFILLDATFALKNDEKNKIKAMMDDYMSRRKSKQPLEYPSAGSIFKRAPGYFTAKLIDDAGLKGKQIGGAQISEKHAGFIINTGGATAADVKALIKLAQETVLDKFDVNIECEIKMLGFNYNS